MVESAVWGFIFGVMAGLLPGIGHLLAVIMAWPLLTSWSALEIFLFYMIMVQVSQFLGSLTTLFTQVPGEPSAMPILQEISKVPAHRIPELVASTAVGSFLGLLWAIAACGLLLVWLPSYAGYFYRTEVILALLILALAAIFHVSKDSIKIKLVMVVSGGAVGLIGWNPTLETSILTFGWAPLMSGIPTALVLICVFAIPELSRLKNLTVLHRFSKIPWSVPKSSLRLTPSTSLLGFVGGLVPGLTVILSSQAAYAWSKIRTQDPVTRITASETANNAGAISQMLPMLLIGLPITSSEALILAVMENRGYSAGIDVGTAFMTYALMPLLLASVVALVIAWPMCMATLKLLDINMKLLRTTAISLLCMLIFYQSWQEMQLGFYLVCFSVLILIGWALVKYDTMLFIFAYFISGRLLEYLSRLYSLHF